MDTNLVGPPRLLTIVSLFDIKTSNYAESSFIMINKRRFKLNNNTRITSKYTISLSRTCCIFSVFTRLRIYTRTDFCLHAHIKVPNYIYTYMDEYNNICSLVLRSEFDSEFDFI